MTSFADHLTLIEREFGGRLTAEQQQATSDALAVFWRDAGDSSEPPAAA